MLEFTKECPYEELDPFGRIGATPGTYLEVPFVGYLQNRTNYAYLELGWYGKYK